MPRQQDKRHSTGLKVRRSPLQQVGGGGDIDAVVGAQVAQRVILGLLVASGGERLGDLLGGRVGELALVKLASLSSTSAR